jgi:hypothetical protein
VHPVKKFSREGKKALTRARRICLALPRTMEKVAWGTPTFRLEKGKIFAMFHEDHHGDGRISLWCNAPRGAQQILVASEPKRFFRPPYVGPAGWVGVVLASVDDERLAEIVRDAYLVTAPKKLVAALSEDPNRGSPAPPKPAARPRSGQSRRRPSSRSARIGAG